MEKQKIYKTIYEIVGKTSTQKYVSTGWFTEDKLAVNNFIEKYPRFKGKASLIRKQVEDWGDSVLISDMAKRGDQLAVFTCKNDILQYSMGG